MFSTNASHSMADMCDGCSDAFSDLVRLIRAEQDLVLLAPRSRDGRQSAILEYRVGFVG
jgi:hypothetical protein